MTDSHVSAENFDGRNKIKPALIKRLSTPVTTLASKFAVGGLRPPEVWRGGVVDNTQEVQGVQAVQLGAGAASRKGFARQGSVLPPPILSAPGADVE